MTNTGSVSRCPWHIYSATALASAILSLYFTATNDLISFDGITYVEVARAFYEDGVRAAFDLFPLPFYSMSIGLIHWVTGLELELSAYLFNTVMLMIASVVFVRIYEEIAYQGATPWAAFGFIIVLPIFNDYREYIIRGVGFWPTMLLALLFFIRYSRHSTIKNAVLWQLFAVIATAFRVEGAAFVLLAPTYFLFQKGSWRSRLSHIVVLNSLNVLLCIVGLVIAVVILIRSGLSDANSPIWLSYVTPASVIRVLQTKAVELQALMPALGSAGEARLILVSGLLGLILVKLAFNANVLAVATMGYGMHRHWISLSKESGIVIFFSGISLLSLMAIAGNQFFLSSRYTIFTVLLISLISCQYINHLINYLIRTSRHVPLAIFGLTVLLFFFDGTISTGASKKNLRAAAAWAVKNIDATDRVACNELRFPYYSDDLCLYIDTLRSDASAEKIQRLAGEGFGYLLLWVKKKNRVQDNALRNNEDLKLLNTFANKRGDEARIYRILGDGGEVDIRGHKPTPTHEDAPVDLSTATHVSDATIEYGVRRHGRR